MTIGHVGLLDVSGSYDAVDCLSGPGPLAPGQIYCPGVLDTYETTSQEFFASQNATPWWIPIAGVLAVFLMLGSRR